MKNVGSFLGALFLGACLTAKADKPVFGNTTNGNGNSFAIDVYNQQSTYGGAVEFTPQENIDLDSITLWLSNYSGKYGERVHASIWTDNDNTPLVDLIDFRPASPNDGSMASFTFYNPSANPNSDPSGSTTLSENIAYWLVVTEGGPPGNYATGAYWVAGGTPSGAAIYDGSDNYYVYNGQFEACSALPAFSINVVPEPGFAGFATLSLLAGIGRRFYMNRKKS